MQTSTDNDHLFHPPTGSSPLHREEAHASHWVNAPREGFTERTKAKHQDRMARSREAKYVGGYTIGWGVSGRKP